MNGLPNVVTSFDLLADAYLALVALVEVSLLAEGGIHAGDRFSFAAIISPAHSL